MDPLSATASVIAVLELSSKVVKYIKSTAGATKERKSLRDELRACEHILQQLKDEADDSDEGAAWLETIKALESPGAPLGRLWVALCRVKVKLLPQDGTKKILADLKWPFDVQEIKKILVTIEREKSLLQLALTNNSRKLIREIEKTSGENKKQLMELIRVIESCSRGSEGHFSGLKDNLGLIQHSQACLRDGLDGLQRRQDNRGFIKERLTILDWLTPIDYAAQQNDFISRRQAGTGQWLLDSVEFKAWMQTQKETLFCPGIPGAGKTILTSIVIDELTNRFRNDETVGVAYVYCNFRRKHEQKAVDLVASLLKQLTQGRTSFPECVKSLYDKHRERRTRPSLDEISRTLQSVTVMYSRVFVITDALDECQTFDGCRLRFLEEIFVLQEKCEANIFATSRFIPEITKSFKKSTSVEVQAARGDMQRYLDGHMFRLPGFVGRSQTLQDEIKTNIVRSVQGMFLLAQLHLESLIGKISPKAVRMALTKLPTGSKAYDRAYKDVMERIEGQAIDQQELAKQVLSWITCAKRPIRTLELQEALAVEVGESELDEDNLPDIEDMISVCAGLVTVDEKSNIIQLIHYTTQEYLERTQAHWFPNAETDIAAICITYLSFPTFEGGFETDGERLRWRQLNPLSDYAARHWIHHGLLASLDSQLVCTFLSSRSKMPSSCLLWAAKDGEEASVCWLLERGAPVNVHDTTGRTPLHYAVLHNWSKCVRLLLDLRAEITADVDNMTALHYTVSTSSEEIAQMFLDAKIPIDSRVKREVWQSAYRPDKISRILEGGRHHANAEINAQRGLTALHYAVLTGCWRLTQFFLNRGADPNAVSEYGETPLHLALKQNLHGAKWPDHVDRWNDPAYRIEDALDSIGFDFESEDEYCATKKAVEEYRFNILCLLLNHQSINVDAQDSFGAAPLHSVLYGNRTSQGIIQRLVQRNAKVSARNHQGKTPLHLACLKGDVDAVIILLEHGANVTDNDIQGLNALHYAAQSGSEETIRLLLDRVTGADFMALVTSRDGRGQNALHHLLNQSEHAEPEVVQYLLTSKVGVDELDDAGMSPLAKYVEQFSLCGKRPRVVELLFQSGADPSARTNSGLGLAHLYAGTSRPTVELFALMANYGVDLRMKDRESRTVLHHCAIAGLSVKMFYASFAIT